MIGRADIEGSKSNVAMNAWLPQASSVLPAAARRRGSASRSSPPERRTGRFSTLCRSVDGRTLSGGRSPYLKHAPGGIPTSYRALNRPALPKGREPGRLRIVSILRIFTRLPCTDSVAGRYPDHLVPKTWREFPASRCVALQEEAPGKGTAPLTATHTATVAAELDPDQAPGPGTRLFS
jgi:hypothetical protein